MEDHSSCQTQLELKTKKIKKKESKPTKQIKENRGNKLVVVKECREEEDKHKIYTGLATTRAYV